MRLKVNFHNDFVKVTSFVNTTSRYSFDVDMVSGRYMIDAKSVLGILTLDISKDIEVVIHADKDDAEPYLQAIGEYIVTDVKDSYLILDES